MNDYVIVGNGVASISAVEKIREEDKEGTITIVSKEPHLTYSRPLISHLLAGEVTEDEMLYRDKDFYEENDVEVLLGKKATGLDTDKKLITLDDGSEIHFDKLLIATGGSPILPEVKGKDLNGVFTFTKWDDAKKIKEYIEENNVEETAVIGGGLIGLKTTEALLQIGLKVDIIELADRILSTTFDKKASTLIEKRLKEKGCRVITENTVEKIKGKEKITGITLQDGEEIKCKMVIFAIGVAPNTELAKDTEIKTDKGINVNNQMQTDVPSIYAAGDVVEETNLITKNTHPIAIWPSAHEQGSTAGTNMVGKSKTKKGGLVMNSVELCDLPTISVGLTDPEGEEFEILENYEDFTYKKLVLQKNRIVGAIFVNDIDRAGIYTGLIKNQTDVSGFKKHLLKDDFGLIFLPKEHRKHLVEGPGIEV